MEKVFLANEQHSDHLVQLVVEIKKQDARILLTIYFPLPAWFAVEVESDGHSHLLDDGDGQDFRNI